jgi:ABC-type cobalamin/Fe3+-siderophores transport system ATPase subunit
MTITPGHPSSEMEMLKRGKIYAAGEPVSMLNIDNIRKVYGICVDAQPGVP